ncbi:Hypothetical predicted protein [Pelobates cultripes]|uniref:Endonuclease/exonuclease/phosphatase domain-containing protein n=1 Tax=Pelobates cultripes TaxID=61616 RepID=A0AAD1RNC2_PELCU|nr:Hypothetical predicted protein [Pelobates cultripes]
MAYTAAPLHVLTQNCRGLNTPEKRSHFLRELHRKRVSVAMLQETHLKTSDTHRLKDRGYPTNYHSTHSTDRKAGVAILVAANTQFTLMDQLADPNVRGYTHYSAIHRRYSRIDYVLIQQEGLQRLQSAEIIPTPWSDHSAVSIHLDSPLFRPTKTAWRLNESLLSDPEVKSLLTEHLTNYFTENDTEDVSKVTLWEAHKSVLWGHLIRIASRKKREAQQHMLELTDQISKLETQHKRSQLEEHYRSLLDTRRQLADLVARKHHRATQRSKAFFYIHANKSGRLLARMIRPQ